MLLLLKIQCMKNLPRCLFVTFLFVFLLPKLEGQSRRFQAGVIAGLNFAELEGDGITDYFGINSGLTGAMRLSRHSQLGMELLFSQNGEYILPSYYPPVAYGRLHLNHLEIPLHMDWLIGVFQREKFYDWNLHFGVAYTRLLGYRVRDIDNTEISSQIIYKDKDAWLLQAGTTYFFTSHIGLNLKASLPVQVDGLSWTLAARMVYMI